MTKEPKEFDKPHFDYGISGSYDMFLKLHHEGDKIGDECNPYDCYNFFVTAWHLWDDWLPKDVNRPKLALEKKGRTTGDMLKLLLAFKNLADGSKHMVLRQSKFKKKVVTDIHPPEIRDWRSFFTDTPRIYLSIDNAIYSMWDIRYIATHYFSWLFDDYKSPRELPEEIKDHLKRCIHITEDPEVKQQENTNILKT